MVRGLRWARQEASPLTSGEAMWELCEQCPKDEILPKMSGILLWFIISIYLVFIRIPGTESLKSLEFSK